MNNKVSVVVPVFNAEKTIKRCIDSVLNQTYENLEIIIINDGSTDSSFEILQKEYGKLKYVKIISVENQGVSHARNLGIKYASGEWILFVDSDDYIDHKMIKTMMESVDNCLIDIVCCNYVVEINGDKYNENFLLQNEMYIFTGKEKIDLMKSCMDARLYGNPFAITNIGVPWAKLYRKKMILNHKFDEDISNMEDMLFNLKAIADAKSILYIPYNLYFYSISNNSLTRRKNENYEVVARCIVNKMNEFVCEYNLKEELQMAMEYKKFCLYYETIYKQYLIDNNKAIFTISKNLRRLDDGVLCSSYHSSLKKIYTPAQKLYGILAKINMYEVLTLLIIALKKIKDRKF